MSSNIVSEKSSPSLHPVKGKKRGGDKRGGGGGGVGTRGQEEG